MKLLTKYSLVNLLVMVVIFIISSITIYILTQAILISERDGNLQSIEGKIEAYVKQNNELPHGYTLDEEKVSFMPTGQQKADSSSQLVQMYSEREKKIHNFRRHVFPLRFNNTWYAVTVAQPVEGMHHLSRALIATSVTTVLVAIIISFLLNSFLLRRLWKPFYASLDIMRSFKLGRTEQLNFPTTNIEEFSFMNDSLLMATEKAEQDYLLLKEFTENASHEMQTPLSVIRSKLDMLIQEKDLSEKQSELAIAAYASIKRLARLNQSLLLLAKIENHQFNDVHELDMKAMVEDKVSQFQELWQSYNITVDCKLNKNIIKINPDLLDILLNNLFSNSVNHNIVNGHVRIEVRQDFFCITNSGIPAPLNEKLLFSRFYKEAANAKSNGLGLSIIKQICKVSFISASYGYINNMHSFTLQW